MNIKQQIIACFDKQILKEFDLTEQNISVPPNTEMGDFCLPTFVYSKKLGKSPIQIAEIITNNFNYNDIVQSTKVVGGYLNFFLNKQTVSTQILNEILSNAGSFAKSSEGKNKTVCIDFSSVNLAKYMHIGHLSTTVIGHVLRNIFNHLGYKTVAINYIGDYGTPFGKMITAYLMWGNEKELIERGVDHIQDLYIKFCQQAELDPTLDDKARECFLKIENKDPEIYPIFKRFIEISIDETKRIYSLLNISFDSWRGESYYSDKMDDIVEEIVQKGLLKDSEGAKIVDLSSFNLGTCLIKKKDGSSLYATRDLAACEDRYKNYKFDKSLYVTDVSQKLHFSQFFKILELLGKPYSQNLHHIYYGRFSLPDGKIASRKGKQALLRDILEYSISKTAQIVENNKNLTPEEKQTIAKSVGVGAVIFSAIKNEKIKDVVFDLDEALDFEGETSPYIQYTHARCCSIIKKANKDEANYKDIDYSQINDATSYELLKSLNRFVDAVSTAANKFEPCLISRALIDISKAFNKYYNNNRVVEDKKVNLTRLAVVHATKNVIGEGLNILGIDAPQKM
ncbi:MAG: arginine--tRNA ligase [Clostridia bacterium]|nr:arginine--tRNA ligase [Clostridia bacterium]